MSELNELYRELIIDHGRNPRHFGAHHHAHYMAEGFNPLCGDQLTIYLNVDEKHHQIESIQFDGTGCAISIASASLMSETLIGKTIDEVEEIFILFHQQVTTDVELPPLMSQKLGKLSVLSGVKAFPSRVKCATLAWHTLQNALEKANAVITTES